MNANSIALGEQLNNLFRQIADGDAAAFKEVFDNWYEPLFNTALAYTKLRELAHDVVQQVFLKLWERKEILHNVSDARSWLYTAARFQAFQALKKEMKQEGYAEKAAKNMEEQFVVTPEQALLAAEIEKAIQKAVHNLTEKQRQAYVLSRYEGRTYRQIATEWGVSIPTIKEHVTKAVKVINEQLAPFRNQLIILAVTFLLFFF